MKLPALSQSSFIKIILLVFLFLTFLFSAKESLAMNYWKPGEFPPFYNNPNPVCEGSSGESMTVNFTDCSAYGGINPNNNCKQPPEPWEFVYAASCQAYVSGSGTDCAYSYTYQYNLCNTEDRCWGSNLGASGYDAAGRIWPGICSASSYNESDPNSACISGGQYKQCCSYPYPGFEPSTYCQNGVCPIGQKTSAGDTTCDAPIVPTATPTPTPPIPVTCTPGEFRTTCTSIPCGGDYCTRLVEQCLSDGSDWRLEYSDCPDYDVCGTCSAGGGGGNCFDGVQNNDETGVDCGGESCPACGGGGGGEPGAADFEAVLSVRIYTWWDYSLLQPFTYGPLVAKPGDYLQYNLWIKNWSGRNIYWFGVYDNFLKAYSTSSSKWDMIRGDVSMPSGDFDSGGWMWDPYFGDGPYTRSGEEDGRGVNFESYWGDSDLGQFPYSSVWSDSFEVALKDTFSAPFGERFYVYYDGGISGVPPPQPYNTCVNSGGTTSGGPSWEDIPCSWWFPSNIVIVTPQVSTPPPQCTAGGTNQANRLLGEYYNETLTGGNFDNANYSGVQRLDPGGSGWLANYFQVDWGGGQPAPGVNADNFKVRWTGWFNASLGSGNYYFWTEADDGTRLWVGTTPGNPGDVLSQSYSWGSPIISDWNLGSWSNCIPPDSVMGGPVNLTGGQWYPIKLEYFEGPAAAAARIKYSRTNNCATSQIIPYTSFRSCTATQPTLGTIGGSVYQNTDGVCSGNTAAPAGWSVTCNPDGTAANITSSTTYQCRDASGNTNLPYGTYVLDLTPPAGWQVITGAGCGPDPQSVTLNSPSVTPLPFYIWQGAGAWFQTQGGDVHTQQEITSRIPSTASDTNFSVVQDNYPGVVSFGGSQANFGQQGGTVSIEGWLANSYFYPSKSDYSYFYQKLGSPTVDNFSCESPTCPTPPSGVTTIYYSANNVNINQNSWAIPANTKVIVLVNGDLNINLNPINGRIIVPPGSFLAFIVKGNINIDGNIGNKLSSIQPFLQGVYLADGMIDTYEPDPVGLGSQFRLIFGGVVYAKGGFNFDRNVGSDCSTTCNSTTPSELFTFRPDLIINAPAEILSSKLSWTEVIP